MVWHLNNYASHQWPLTYSKCQCHTLTVFLLINHDSVNTGCPVGSFTNSPEEASVYGLILAVNIPPKSSLPHSVGQHIVNPVQLHKSTFTPKDIILYIYGLSTIAAVPISITQQQHINTRSTQLDTCNRAPIRLGDCQQPHAGTHQCLSVSLGTQRTLARLASCDCHCEVCLECGLHCMRLQTGLTCLWPHQHVPHQHVLVYSGCCWMLLDSHPCRQLGDGLEIDRKVGARCGIRPMHEAPGWVVRVERTCRYGTTSA